MGKLEFTHNSEPTVGIELELGLVDRDTMELKSAFDDVFRNLPAEFQETIKPELMQCYLEINTGVCKNIDEARTDLESKISMVETACDKAGVRLWWGATHPFSSWRDQEVTNNERYQNLLELLQEMAQRLVTFGLHIHVGVDSGDKAVMICDRILQHLPTLLAISASSPFWENRSTGLRSNRSKIMEGLPTAGMPPLMRNWSEFTWLVNHMIDTGFINTIREIWWDVRPHHKFGTVEVRMCDMPCNLEDSLAIGALVQCLVKALSDLIDRGTYQHDCHPMMVQQNKWRACRFGNKAQLVNSTTHESQSVSLVVNSLVEHLIPTSRLLGCEPYLERVRQMASGPSWADKQLKILEKTGDPREIVRQISDQARVSPGQANPTELGIST